MEFNAPLIAIVIVLITGLIIFITVKNHRDKKKYERETIDAETPVDKHVNDRT